MKNTNNNKDLNDKILEESKDKIDERIVNYIVFIVGKYFDVQENYYNTKNRKREIVFARQTSMYLILKYTDLTLKKIGKFFGKDHATVIHGKNTVLDLIESDKKIENQIKELENIIDLKSKSMIEQISLDNDFYYIDFNNHVSIKLKNDKGIILTGFTEDEINELKKDFEIINSREHKNTGLYILEKLI